MKTKLTPEVQSTIIKQLKAGNYAAVAAEVAGIDETTFYRWLARGEDEKQGKYFEFRKAVKKAEALSEAHAVTQVRLAGTISWQAAMTWLERKFPERWARREVMEVTGKSGGAIEHHVFAEAVDKIYGEHQRNAEQKSAEKAPTDNDQ